VAGGILVGEGWYCGHGLHFLNIFHDGQFSRIRHDRYDMVDHVISVESVTTEASLLPLAI